MRKEESDASVGPGLALSWLALHNIFLLFKKGEGYRTNQQVSEVNENTSTTFFSPGGRDNFFIYFILFYLIYITIVN